MTSTSSLLGSLVGAFEKYLAADTNATMEARSKAGEYHFIPLDLPRFRDQFERARMAALFHRGKVKNPPPLKFIDVGCGIGTKVLAAQVMSVYGEGAIEAYGIEKEARYVGVARGVMSVRVDKPAERIILGNALRHDYSPYDIIYFYRPLCNPELQVKLEERIISTAKKGTIIMANGAQSDDFRTWDADAKTGKRVREVWDRVLFQRL
jgi:hypothetical protein